MFLGPWEWEQTFIWDESNLHRIGIFAKCPGFSLSQHIRELGCSAWNGYPEAEAVSLFGESDSIYYELFDLVLLVATDGYAYDVFLRSFVPKSISKVDIDTALQVNLLVFDCLGSNSCYY